ncbi:ribonuclease H-like domain-containing protein [Tanacetum coccineum]
MIAIRMKKFLQDKWKERKFKSKGTIDGKRADCFYQDQEAGKKEQNRTDPFGKPLSTLVELNQYYKSNVNIVRPKQPVPTSNSNSFSLVRPQDHQLKYMEGLRLFDSGSKGYITGKGRIRVGNLEFDSVSFVKELGHFNLFSISQICDKQHKDETSGILQNFIRQIENQLNHRVKIIRSDNGTEFKNRDMLEFCGNKGIKQEYSNARTPQQNSVAERINRT